MSILPLRLHLAFHHPLVRIRGFLMLQFKHTVYKHNHSCFDLRMRNMLVQHIGYA